MRTYDIAVKDGVTTDRLHPLCFQAWLEAAIVYNQRNITCTITSVDEFLPNRLANSLHYTVPHARAFDLRTWRIPKNTQKILVEKIQARLKKLNTHFQVVLKSDHIHIELDYRSKS